MKLIWLNLKQGLKRPLFYFSILLTLIILFLPILSKNALSSYARQFLSPARVFMQCYEGSKALILSVPALICALAFSYWYAQNYISGMEKYIFIKVGKNRYYNSLIIANFILSGLALFIGLLILYLFALFTFKAPVDEQFINSIIIGSVFEGIGKISVHYFIFAIILHSTFFGMVYGTLGMAISFFIKNKFVALVSPFVFYTFGSLFALHVGLTKIEPKATFNVGLVTNNNAFYIYGSLFVILILSIALSRWKFVRDLKNDEEF